MQLRLRAVHAWMARLLWGVGTTRNVSSSLDGREGMTVGQQNQRRHEQMTPMGEGFYWNVGTRSQWWSAWTCVRNPIQHSRRYTWMQYRYHLQDIGTECATRSDAWTLVSLSSTWLADGRHKMGVSKRFHSEKIESDKFVICWAAST